MFSEKVGLQGRISTAFFSFPTLQGTQMGKHSSSDVIYGGSSVVNQQQHALGHISDGSSSEVSLRHAAVENSDEVAWPGNLVFSTVSASTFSANPMCSPAAERRPPRSCEKEEGRWEADIIGVAEFRSESISTRPPAANFNNRCRIESAKVCSS